MKVRKIFFIVATILLGMRSASAQFTVSGFVKDAKTGEVLVGAHVYDSLSGSGVCTNNYGYFSLSSKQQSAIQISFIGYHKQNIVLVLKSDTVINIAISEGNEIDEVLVRANKRIAFNTTTLSVKELERMPSLGSKPDILKAMQLLPGIQGQSEGTSLLLVRGGSPGENLYLLDHTPLIYVNHLGGVTSVFNPDMINSISIYKGGFPAEYGGKLSSVVNIAQRSGSQSNIKGSFSIGLLDASLLLEGPLSNKASFIFTGRTTLFGLLFYGYTSLAEFNEYKMYYGYHDMNGKITWSPNYKNNLYFNIYQGDDYLSFKSKPESIMQNADSKLKNTWGNWLFSTGWNHTASARLFVENNLSYTRYRLKDKQSINDKKSYQAEREFKASVQDVTFRSLWNYKMLPNWTLQFGLQPSVLIHTPYEFSITGTETFSEKNSVNAIQAALFTDNKIELAKNVQLNLGARAVNYTTNGLSENWIEPRINMTVKLNSKHKLNASYMQAHQNSHLLHTTGSVMNNEVWIPATKEIPSSKSWQTSVGWMGLFMNDMFSGEASLYYKEMNDLASYKAGYINLKGNPDWANSIEIGGEGMSYGLELLVKKNYENWTGTIGYTYSHTTRNFSAINNGYDFLYDYDRPHNLSLILNRKLSEKWDFNMAWLYQTGLPYTPVIGRQYTPSLDLDYNSQDYNLNNDQGESFYYEALIYGERNSGRMNNYHRLDIGFNYTKTTKKNRKAVWTFSVYNVYNRQNASYYYYNNNDTDEIHHPEMNNGFKPVNMYQMSLFPILPSFSYKLFFNKGDNPKPFKNRFDNLLYHQ